MRTASLSFLLFLAASAFAQSSVDGFEYRVVPNNAYAVGERLKYGIKYAGVKAVNTEIAVVKDTVVRGRECYKIEYKARTVPVFDNFYRVDDRYETFIDKQGQFPHSFKQQIREGKFAHDEWMEFFHDKGLAKSLLHGREFPMEPYAQDILSAYFYVRTMDLRSMKDGSIIELKNVSDKEVIPLKIKIRNRDLIETDLGVFRAIVVEPIVQGVGLFKSDGQILIWMTDDENKIPLRIKIKVVVGSLMAEIESMEGLRNPLKSKMQE
ncbi:MAG: DUF3108 domain-containing protein [Chloroherpetonaceae bacterium]|nr:DUF3108 domain-containing protein [Chloroherpetonaceae bacterium]MDW8438047.1 DUF3108 domain-containing protein [Chloroherpetonaceae bacterium]